MKGYFFSIFLMIGIFAQDKKQYHFTLDPIDTVIPCHEKDLATLPLVVDAAYKHVVNVRRVIVVSNKQLIEKAKLLDENLFPFDKQSIAMAMCDSDSTKSLSYISMINNCVDWVRVLFLKLSAMISSNNLTLDTDKQLTKKAEWFDESLFPFDKYSIAMEMFNHNNEKASEYINMPNSRIDWIYQQFLKLFAMFVIPDISSNVLILDADTIFFKDINFQDEFGAGLYNPGNEYNEPYFTHGAKVLKNFKKVFPEYSGISHHMLFQRSILEDLISNIEQEHAMDAWRVLAKYISPNDKSGISEYELYFNFAFANTDQVKIRHLKWCNITDITMIDVRESEGFDCVSCHRYMRDT